MIRQRWPGIAVLVLSQWAEEHYATELLSGTTAGVGYLLVIDVGPDDLTLGPADGDQGAGPAPSRSGRARDTWTRPS